MGAIKKLSKYMYNGEVIYIPLPNVFPNKLPISNTFRDAIRDEIYSRAKQHTTNMNEYANYIASMLDIPWSIYCYDITDRDFYVLPSDELIPKCVPIRE